MKTVFSWPTLFKVLILIIWCIYFQYYILYLQYYFLYLQYYFLYLQYYYYTFNINFKYLQYDFSLRRLFQFTIQFSYLDCTSAHNLQAVSIFLIKNSCKCALCYSKEYWNGFYVCTFVCFKRRQSQDRSVHRLTTLSWWIRLSLSLCLGVCLSVCV